MSKAKFVEGSIGNHILSLTLPALVVILVNMSIVLTDMYFVSRLGHLPIVAMGFIFPIIEMVQGIGLGMGIALSIGVAHFLGNNQFQHARAYLGFSIGVAASLSLLILSFGFVFHGWIFHALGASEEVIPYIWAFMKYWLASMFVYMLMFSMNFGMRGHGEIKLNTSLFILTAMLNLVFAPLFIFGLLGFPAMGIAGSAIAGLCARFIVMVMYAIVIYHKQWIAWPKRADLQAYGQRFFKTCIPASLTNFIPPISIAITTAMLASISLDAVAAFGIASRIQVFAVLPLFALSGAISAIIAQNYAAKQVERAHQTLHISLLSSISWGAFIAFVLLLIKRPALGLFSADENLINIGAHYLMIVPISYIGWGMIMMLCSYFNAIGKPFLSTIVSLCRMLVVFIPLALLLKHFYSYEGIFVALSFSNLAVAFLAWFVQSHYYASENIPIVLQDAK